MENLTAKIRNYLLENGACDVGFAKVSYEGLDYAVSIVVKLSDFVISQIDTAPTYTYFNHYKTANALIDRLGLLCGNLIEKEGGLYMPIPASQTVNGHNTYAGEFSHKKAAVCAGLGTIGKNALFLHAEYGPAVRLGTIFTNLPLETSQPLKTNLCDSCNQCVKHCPAQALYGKAFSFKHPEESLLDRKACSDYMKKHYMHIGRGSVCGICIKKCVEHFQNKKEKTAEI